MTSWLKETGFEEIDGLKLVSEATQIADKASA
jgi:hypothetical protein